MPDKQECHLSSLALPPGEVDSDTIKLDCEHGFSLVALPEKDTRQYNLTLGLSWEPPEVLHGGNQYRVSISDGTDLHNSPLISVVWNSLLLSGHQFTSTTSFCIG